VHRRDASRPEKIKQERMSNTPPDEEDRTAQLDEATGTENPNTVTGIKVRDVTTGDVTKIDLDGVFVAIGHAPATELFKGQLEMKPSGYLVTAPDSTRTSIPGVFAAGDVKDDVFRQAVTAAGMGCMAALETERYLAHSENVAKAAE
jgi:thioredoxin reductase (NADPH)